MSKLNSLIVNRITILTTLAVLFTAGCKELNIKKDFDPVELVNPLMGTDSEYRLSHGNTYPAIALPWGMNFWTPQTRAMGNGWAYAYDDNKIMGIKQTHQPSPWINDYAAFSLMAETGKLKLSEDDRASWFSHKAEVAKPYYYSVYLADYDVTAEVTPTERCSVFRFTFPENDSSYILLDAYNRGSMVKIIPAERKVIGYCRNNRGGVPSNFYNYFIAVFDKDFSASSTWHGDTLELNKLEQKGYHSGAVLRFKTARNEKINVYVASSFISPEQAELNLKRETGEKNFDKVMKEGKTRWNENWEE